MNNFFEKKIKKINNLLSNNSEKVLSRAEYMSKLGIDCNSKLRNFIKVNAHLKKISGSNNDKIAASIASKNTNLLSTNDIYYYIIREKINMKSIKKNAYPNSSSHYSEGINDEYDVEKWASLVHKIYSAVESGDMILSNAIDYYGNALGNETGESDNFKRWMKYYGEGNHLKYSEESHEMKKNAVYGMSLLGSGEYDRPSTYHDSVESGKVEGKTKKDFLCWKNKLHAAIRRIDKLMRSSHMERESYRDMAEMLLNLSDKIIKLSPVTAADLTYRAANTLSKIGRNNDAQTLIKIAQEIPAQAEAPAVQQQPQEIPAENQDQGQQAAAEKSSAEQRAEDVGLGTSDSSEPVPLQKIETPDPRPGEYDKVLGDINLDDASEKLDEVAGMLADRRIIRLLAEFDIMLDKLGVASMFPELAESQSKLIDGYSYALTRVTKMMGQLSNAKSFVDSGDSEIPGAPSEQQEAGSPEE
tara:strand:+ start:13268 stop:14680 length:1413 start_codon:yes stop_codon:yes gene_type:complete